MLQESINIPRSACTIAPALLAKRARARALAHIKCGGRLRLHVCINFSESLENDLLHTFRAARNTRNWAKRAAQWIWNASNCFRFASKGGRAGQQCPFSWCRAIAIRSRAGKRSFRIFRVCLCVLLLAHIFDDRSFMWWRAWFVGNRVRKCLNWHKVMECDAHVVLLNGEFMVMDEHMLAKIENLLRQTQQLCFHSPSILRLFSYGEYLMQRFIWKNTPHAGTLFSYVGRR